MNLICQNPFRVLGLPISATDREITKRISDLSIFMKMGKKREFDCDSFLPVKTDRNLEAVEMASQKIDQPDSKLFHATFWFWGKKDNTVDQMAFQELKNGNIDKAIEFWEKATSNGIMEINHSNHKNLSILYLGLSCGNGKLNKDMFLKGLNLSGKFFTNGFSEEFISYSIGTQHSVDHLEVLDSHVDSIIAIAKPYLNTSEGLLTKELINAFSSYPDEIRNGILDKFIGKQIYNIESEIKKCENERVKNVASANKAGFKLVNRTNEDIKYLGSILTASDLKYQLIADKLANEIVECSIRYFNKFHSSEIDPGDAALKLTQLARKIAVGEKTKQRINDGLPILIEYVKDRPKREKFKTVQEEVNYIYRKIDEIQRKKFTPLVLSEFVNKCSMKLDIIGKSLGETDADYLELSDLVVNITIGACVTFLTILAEACDTFSQYKRKALLQHALAEIKPILGIVRRMDMKSSTKSEFDGLCKKLGIQEECYIATMVYGSYDTPEVMVLRKFRDEVLKQSWMGRKFIKIYYKYSPSLVRKTKNFKITHVIFKLILNPFVSYLKAKDE